ncbi:unnamed protein product, partial [Ceratitis capitata]
MLTIALCEHHKCPMTYCSSDRHKSCGGGVECRGDLQTFSHMNDCTFSFMNMYKGKLCDIAGNDNDD